MRVRLYHASPPVELLDDREPDWPAAAGVLSMSQARALIARDLADPVSGRALRELLQRLDGAATIFRHRDPEVLESLAWRLHCADLRFVEAGRLATLPALPPIPDSVARAAEPPPLPPRPVAQFREPPPLPPRDAPPDEVADLEQDVQAAALEEASEQGVPFCEECERRRRERELAGAPS